MTVDQSTQIVQGTPSECGFYNVGFSVYDNSVGGASASLPLTVIGASAVTICSPVSGTLPASAEGATNYSVPLVAVGGTGPYTWTLTGAPPDLLVVGSTLTTTGFTISDVNVSVPWSVTLVATDSNNVSSPGVTNQLTITGAPVLNSPTTGALPGAPANPLVFYQQAFSVTCSGLCPSLHPAPAPLPPGPSPPPPPPPLPRRPVRPPRSPSYRVLQFGTRYRDGVVAGVGLFPRWRDGKMGGRHCGPDLGFASAGGAAAFFARPGGEYSSARLARERGSGISAGGLVPSTRLADCPNERFWSDTPRACDRPTVGVRW